MQHSLHPDGGRAHVYQALVPAENARLQLAWARVRLRRRLRATVPAPEAVRVQALEVAQRRSV